MARGRMLNKKISLNRKVAQLANELGGEAALVYTWAIAHLDRDGRIAGDPETLCAQVAPMVSGVTPEVVGGMLELADRLGLIVLYSIGGDWFVEYPKFKENQQGMRYDRETPSSIPSADSASDADSQLELRLPQVTYFVHGKTTGLIKIGSSKNPAERLQQLRSQASEEMELLATGGVEAEYHKNFADSRVHGEWFEPNALILEEIDRLRQVAGEHPANIRRTSGEHPANIRRTSGEHPANIRRPPAESKVKEGKVKEEKRREEKPPLRGVRSVPLSRPAASTTDIERVRAHYLATFPEHATVILARESNIADRLREGLTVKALCRAIDGCAESDWHRREGRTALHQIFRDGEKVAELMALADKPKRVKGLSDKTQRMAEDLAEFVKEGDETAGL